MAKQKQVSAENYIRTRARTLPIDACYVNFDWEIAKMANVAVLRRHVTGNITCAFYMVDLLCRGIKDSFYYFNLPYDEINENFGLDEPGRWQRISYELAHNIVYAGHDFAMTFRIEPHKEFSVSKFILEEDNDNVPLIEIETGDEEQKPHLMVNPSEAYADVLAKLEKYAGKGNYTFTVMDDIMDQDYEEMDDDDDDDESGIAESLDDEYLDDIEPGFLDFNHISDVSHSVLVRQLRNEKRRPTENFIIKSELLLRIYNQKTNETVFTDEDETTGSSDYKMFENGQEKVNRAYERTKPLLAEIMAKANELQLLNLFDEHAINNYLFLIDGYKEKELAAWMLLQGTPLMLIIQVHNELLKRWEQYPILVQLFIAAVGLMLKEPDIELYRHILSAENVDRAYPANMTIHSLHHKFFWVVKANAALNAEDEKSLWHWHNLIRMTGIGGTLKTLYAARLHSWLSNKLQLEEDESLAYILENMDSL